MRNFFPSSLSVESVGRMALLLAFGHAVAIFALGWSIPIIEQHSFRQTQTALSVYWLLQGGDWLIYQTPVLGAPWTIPFELPLYQWLVAGLILLSGLGIEQAGRLVSFAFLLATLWPLRVVLSRVLGSFEPFWIAGALLLTAPTYLFWGRTVMIESTALFLSVAFLAALVIWLERKEPVWLALCTAVGTLAILVKVTTFPPFALAGGGLVAAELVRGRAWRQRSMVLRQYGPALLTVLVPLVALVLWVAMADHAKEAGLVSKGTTSTALKRWNYGSWDQVVSAKLWQEVVLNRAVVEAVGSLVPLVAAFLAALLLSWRWAAVVVALTGLYLVDFLVFTNLHMVHNYYQYANAIFLVAATAAALWVVGQSSSQAMAGLLATILAMQASAFYREYFPSMRQDFSSQRTLLVGEFLRNNTQPDSVVVAFGFGWSSEVAYYSQRRSVTVDWRLPPAALATGQGITGGLPISAYVHCPATSNARVNEWAELKALYDTPPDGFQLSEVGGCRILYVG